jgi:hypothetical protein
MTIEVNVWYSLSQRGVALASPRTRRCRHVIGALKGDKLDCLRWSCADSERCVWRSGGVWLVGLLFSPMRIQMSVQEVFPFFGRGNW